MNTGEKWVASILMFGLMVGACALGMVARSDGKIDHCWVEFVRYPAPSYVVMGHRNWRSDVTVAHESTAEEAEAKRKLLCP